MHYGLYVSAAGALANSYRQDVIANNLANVDTVSFKRDLTLLRARSTEVEQGGARGYSNRLLECIGGGAGALPTATDFSPASLNLTGRDLDVALDGEGFFSVSNDGQIQFTRDGRFALDEQNRLVTFDNHLPVLDEGNQAIILDPDYNNLSINQAGMISQDGKSVARLSVVDFDNTSSLNKVGNNFYVLEGDALSHRAEPPLRQGALENSGVNPIKEMTGMIKAQRLFELNLNMLRVQDQTLGLAVTRLASIS